MGISRSRRRKIFLSIFRQRINDHFIQNWHQRLNESSRASFYRQMCVFQFQPYLEKVVHKKIGNAISKLRLSSHILNLVVGIDLTPLRERIACAPHVIFWRMNFILCLNVLYIIMKSSFLLNLIIDVDIACLS